MLKGFRDFVLRGNVVDLAVGVVIGAAFSGLVTQLTESFLEPLIRLISGGQEFAGTWRIGGQQFDWAAFLNAVVAFLLTAVALYFVIVLPMNKLAERRSRGVEPESAAPSEEIILLREIRDALVGGRGAGDSVPRPRRDR